MVNLTGMKVADIMTPREKIVAVQKNENIGAAIGQLLNEGLHNVVVFDGQKYIGVFGHKQLVKLQNIPRELSKVEHFVFRPTKILKNSTLTEAAYTMYRNNCDILPIFEGEKFLGVISERDVLRAVIKTEELQHKRVSEIMTPDPYCVKENDKIATALAMMRDFRVSRLPVLNKKGQVSGLLESFEAIKRIVLKETPESRIHFYGYKSGPGVGEELPVYKVPVRELMNSHPVLAAPEDFFVKKVEEMEGLNESTIIVINKAGEPLGLIAPRDIVEWVSSFKSLPGVYMQISGFDPSIVGEFAESQLHRMIEETLQKLAAIVKIREFAVHFKTYHETFDRFRYSLRVRVYTDYGLFVEARHGYDIIAVANELFDGIERQVIEYEKKHRDITREKERHTKISKKGE